jgi:hypothetical protein
MVVYPGLHGLTRVSLRQKRRAPLGGRDIKGRYWEQR